MSQSGKEDRAAVQPRGFHLPQGSPSLPEVYQTIEVPQSLGFWRKMLAFAGPGYMVAVGYMDPGNWATDLAAGARFNYTLLSVIMISNLMAILLQALAVKLGIVTGRDLAQACRDYYSKPVSIVLWVLCEIAIAACDLAEVIGSAIALNLLFGLPLAWGVCLTALDVLAVLYLQQKGFRYIEAFVIALIGIIGTCFAIEIVLSRPSLSGILAGFVPRAEILRNPEMLYIAIGILGATVMPHNLYLHSSIVQTRRYGSSSERAERSHPLRHARLDGSSHVRSLHQCRDPDHGRCDVSSFRKPERRRNWRCLQAAFAAAWHDAGQHSVRRRPAVLRSEFHADGNARRADRHGGLSEHPACAPGCAA